MLVTVVLGLGVRTLVVSAWTGPAGDVLYAVMVYLLIAFLVPRHRRAVIAAFAFAACVALAWTVDLAVSAAARRSPA